MNGFTSFREQIDPFLCLLLFKHEINFLLSGLARACPEMLSLLPIAPKLPSLQWIPYGKERKA